MPKLIYMHCYYYIFVVYENEYFLIDIMKRNFWYYIIKKIAKIRGDFKLSFATSIPKIVFIIK